jgi:hypothetical protein
MCEHVTMYAEWKDVGAITQCVIITNSMKQSHTFSINDENTTNHTMCGHVTMCAEWKVGGPIRTLCVCSMKKENNKARTAAYRKRKKLEEELRSMRSTDDDDDFEPPTEMDTPGRPTYRNRYSDYVCEFMIKYCPAMLLVCVCRTKSTPARKVPRKRSDDEGTDSTDDIMKTPARTKKQTRCESLFVLSCNCIQLVATRLCIVSSKSTLARKNSSSRSVPRKNKEQHNDKNNGQRRSEIPDPSPKKNR